MTGKKTAAALAIALGVALGAATGATAGDFAQRMGYGYGPGYNAPVPPGYGAYGYTYPYCTWQRGCCEIPASWRLHVWDTYQGDYCSWHMSFCGVPKGPMGQGYGYGYGAGQPGCVNCQPGAAMAPSSAAPTLAQPAIPESARRIQP